MQKINIIAGIFFSRLCSSQKDKKNKLYFCDYYINSFRSEISLKNIEYCSQNDAIKIKLPKEGSKLKLKNHKNSMKHPVVFYADFECFTQEIENNDIQTNKNTTQYQRHLPSGFCLKLVTDDDRIDYPQKSLFGCTKKKESDDIAQIFIDKIQFEVKIFYNTFKFSKNMIFGEKEK